MGFGYRSQDARQVSGERTCWLTDVLYSNHLHTVKQVTGGPMLQSGDIKGRAMKDRLERYRGAVRLHFQNGTASQSLRREMKRVLELEQEPAHNLESLLRENWDDRTAVTGVALLSQSTYE
ncbi:unnamed protein product, partial [Amoebophrya sp. A25]|eukprot:GSA25T00027473001.1